MRHSASRRAPGRAIPSGTCRNVLEGARELGVVTEAETIGDLGDRQTIGGIAQLGVTGVEPLVP